MSSRAYCPGCNYPLSVCLCDAVTPLDNSVSVTILQHPSEQHHAKNTARLLALGLHQCQIICGENADDFSLLRQQVLATPREWAVLYPAEKSRQLDADTAGMSVIKHLLLLDGTWKKTYKLWQLNCWLHTLPCWQLKVDNPGIYQRKAKWAGSLSTLECAAFALNKLEGLSIKPLLDLLQHRQQQSAIKVNGFHRD